MIQLVLNIDDESVANKLLLMLEQFKDKGVIIEKKEVSSNFRNFNYTDEEIEKNWKEILMGIKSDLSYYKSEKYYEDRGNYLIKKYK